uniref:DNA-directed RNA polymerase n=1 Tax=Nephromyces sp. ex Molgula occidentalis TaxID=2544991 RepID=A0A5C1H7K4_9APIC|nr:plastid-encoded DNA-directed RNA polymerase beta''A [Nephromyces sp. ex Molgula occidentalis]
MNFKFNFITNNQNQFLLEKSIINSFSYKTSSQFLQELMFLGFEYALNYSFSLNLENFKSYFYLAPLLRKNNYLKFTYLWSYSLNKIKIFEINKKDNQSFNKFFEFINIYKQLNPISNSLHFMINTKAKANWNQLLQLIGFRGYISNINGYLYEIPIMQNFNKGLNLYEYFISCYGTRKGIIDTAIKTADSGYLTRKLVESSQNIIIKEYNWGTQNNIFYNKYIDIYGNLIEDSYYLKGKNLKKIIDTDKNIIYISNKYIYLTNSIIYKIKNLKLNLNGIYSCISGKNICNNCYGYNNKNNNLGESVGVLAAQTIGEPGTQLILRTFHTGGVFTTNFNNNIKLKKDNIFKKLNYLNNLNFKVLSFKKLFQTKYLFNNKNLNYEFLCFNKKGILINDNILYKKYFNFYNIKKLIKLKFNYLDYNNKSNIYHSNQIFSPYININNLLKKNYILPQKLIFKNSYQIINNKLILLIIKNKLNNWILNTLNNDITFCNPLKTIYLFNNSKIIWNFNNNYLNNLIIKKGFKLKFSNIFNTLNNIKLFKINFKLKTYKYNIYNISNKFKIKTYFSLLNKI